MRKIACFLLAVIMIAAFATTALAADITASYDHGKLTVSTTADNWFRINVDGVGTGRSLTPKVPALTFDYELSDGDHLIAISSDIVGGGSVMITVINGSSQTSGAEPGSDPQQSEETSNQPGHTEHTPVEIPEKAPDCTNYGLTGGVMCKNGGEILKDQSPVPPLGHRYLVAGKSDETVTYKCLRCDQVLKAGVHEAVKNRLGNIITNMQGQPVDYTAGTAKDEEKCLVLNVEKPFGEATLTLDGSLIMQLIREGYDHIEFVNGKADLLIPLNRISNAWFNTNGPISGYLFSTNPDSDFEITLRVAARVGNEIVVTEQYNDLELK